MLPASPAAHRLDEYLQAARIAFTGHEVELELDVTPGANIAADEALVIDRDHDGAISAAEAETWGLVSARSRCGLRRTCQA